MSSYVPPYVPGAMSTLLSAAISEAVPELLDRHDSYTVEQLSSYLGRHFPESPATLRGPVVVAATAGARHASLLHAVCEKNVASIDPAKRRYAGETASALSFWALGLRPTPRSGLAMPRSSSAAASAMDSGTESCPRSSEVLAADLRAPVPTDERPALGLATLKLPVPIPRQDSEFEVYYVMSPISESGVPAGSEVGVRTPGSRDHPLTIEANDDDLDEDLPPAPSPAWSHNLVLRFNRRFSEISRFRDRAEEEDDGALRVYGSGSDSILVAVFADSSACSTASLGFGVSSSTATCVGKCCDDS